MGFRLPRVRHPSRLATAFPSNNSDCATVSAVATGVVKADDCSANLRCPTQHIACVSPDFLSGSCQRERVVLAIEFVASACLTSALFQRQFIAWPRRTPRVFLRPERPKRPETN